MQLHPALFPNAGLGLREFRRVLRNGGRAGICVISTPDRAPMWGILADVLGRHLPDQRSIPQLSFSLADPARLDALFTSAGFQDIRIEQQKRDGVFDSFDEYWKPISARTGSLPQIYLTLPEPERNMVRDEVRARLAEFQSTGQFRMSVEMLVASGRA